MRGCLCHCILHAEGLHTKNGHAICYEATKPEYRNVYAQAVQSFWDFDTGSHCQMCLYAASQD